MKKLCIKIIPGIKVKILDRRTLINAGYEDNNDKNDFLNLVAGETVTIDQVFEEEGIYTCMEYPEVAIYKVFIEHIIYSSINPSNETIGNIFGISRETVRRTLASALKSLEKNISKNNEIKEFYYD